MIYLALQGMPHQHIFEATQLKWLFMSYRLIVHAIYHESNDSWKLVCLCSPIKFSNKDLSPSTSSPCASGKE
jgi:hypothetical protein